MGTSAPTSIRCSCPICATQRRSSCLSSSNGPGPRRCSSGARTPSSECCDAPPLASDIASDVSAAEGGADCFAHGYQGVVTRCHRVVADMNLNAIGDGQATPGERSLIVERNRGIGANAQCRRERLGNSPLELIAGGVAHLSLDDLQRLAFT